MGIALSLLLVAAGAILTWAVSADVSGVEIQTVGVILMVVGIVGAILSVVFWSSWGGFGTYHRERVIRDRDHVVERLAREEHLRGRPLGRPRHDVCGCPRPAPTSSRSPAGSR